ncbi:MAG: 3-dehydroquinate synthase [Polyangiaceae bacterium]|nr:3-dehydroquinate synthase [Polyangiaceae bacterium]
MNHPLLLSGFMATGKSTVGKIVAKKTSRPFFDLDQQIEKGAGCTIAQIFSEKGEAAFREIEQRTLRALLDFDGVAPVISLGGGALIDRPWRVEVLGRTVVVSLEASLPVLIARAKRAASGVRPLLAAHDPEYQITRLLEQRALGYRESHDQICTDELSPAEVAEKVIATWRRDEIAVAAGFSSYCVSIGHNKIATELERKVGSPSGLLFVSDENVAPLHGQGVRNIMAKTSLPHSEVLLPPGEPAKNLQIQAKIYQAAFEARLDRQGLMIGLGGGVVTDMTGFAAATWVRGIRWLGLPTTLLSMVDASVGGKTAVDFSTAKNSVGAFWQPSGVICDVSALKTESERAYRGALSEVIKTALIGDATLLDFLEEKSEEILARDFGVMTEVLDRCVRVKARVVSLDEREAGVRASLNLGHTIGHALESSGGYEELTHGEAVSLGLVAALRLGNQLGVTETPLTERVLQLLERLGLPHRLKANRLEEATQLLGLDKKRAGSEIKFIFCKSAGDVMFKMVSLDDLIRLTPALADRL